MLSKSLAGDSGAAVGASSPVGGVLGATTPLRDSSALPIPAPVDGVWATAVGVPDVVPVVPVPARGLRDRSLEVRQQQVAAVSGLQTRLPHCNGAKHLPPAGVHTGACCGRMVSTGVITMRFDTVFRCTSVGVCYSTYPR